MHDIDVVYSFWREHGLGGVDLSDLQEETITCSITSCVNQRENFGSTLVATVVECR
jgi:hypothetical protein